jgi:uncharacterized protein
MQRPDFDKVILECKKYSKLVSPKDLHHGFEHSQRVRDYAVQIAKSEKADPIIVEIAAYLHDIGRGHEKNQYHTKVSSQMAKIFLTNLGLPKNQIKKVIHCIETHSRKHNHRKIPKTKEAKILYDADGLEMIGAIGILRMVLSAQIQNKNWSHVIEKANWRIRIKEDFLTATGKIIAKQRQNLIMQFVSQLKKELKNTIK